ncbi:hypothetical protein [Nocardioides piscis]|uniref:Uncharacterized protein n=1 Tax=Nocardioides piscis TaxID=2714938 RepID=A0A6G7YFV5_9ACTN|nr:hypothetical protein [Nocardioides piscis]QIK75487.1 hypothetical protein G7071_08570 [Nocardioides piscis]
MPDEKTTDDMVSESALQLWAAAQTDFDPFEVDPSEWGPHIVPIRDVDIATDTGLEIEAVRESLRRDAGRKLVLGEDGGNLSVTSIVPADEPL